MSEPKSDTKLKPIPVRMLRFPDHPIDVPGKNGVSGLKASGPDTPAGQQRWEIEHHPWIRAFRIAFYKPSIETPEVLFVAEARCTWEYAPL
jgi:hypothetical protein